MIEYEPGDPSAYVPMDKWGQDHWSTLAYVETRAVDHKGMIENKRMRCNARLHRRFAHWFGDGDYPTRLRDATELHNHDDWSCLEDMVAMHVLKLFIDVNKAQVQLLPLGVALAAQLRVHKMNGGKWSTFAPAGLP